MRLLKLCRGRRILHSSRMPTRQFEGISVWGPVRRELVRRAFGLGPHPSPRGARSPQATKVPDGAAIF
jgi:hypothetical protein